MRSRSNVVATLAFLLSASLLTACSGSEDDPGTPESTPEQAAPSYDESSAFTARVLPRMAGAGEEPAAADDAAFVVEARLKKALKKAQPTVELYALQDGEWEVVAEAEADKSGYASLTTTAAGDLHVIAETAEGDVGAALSSEDTPAVSFSDEFDEPSVNTDDAKWRTRNQGYIGVRQCSKADDAAAQVSDLSLIHI